MFFCTVLKFDLAKNNALIILINWDNENDYKANKTSIGLIQNDKVKQRT